MSSQIDPEAAVAALLKMFQDHPEILQAALQIHYNANPGLRGTDGRPGRDGRDGRAVAPVVQVIERHGTPGYKEVVKVTKFDDAGRIVEFEKRFVPE